MKRCHMVRDMVNDVFDISWVVGAPQQHEFNHVLILFNGYNFSVGERTLHFVGRSTNVCIMYID